MLDIIYNTKIMKGPLANKERDKHKEEGKVNGTDDRKEKHAERNICESGSSL